MKSINNTVLVIEDDDQTASLLENALNLQGLDVIKSASTNLALSQIKNQDFSCILLDLNLAKGGKGEDILQFLEDAKNRYDTPVIVVSGSIDNSRIQNILKRVDDIIVKPFDIQTLTNRVLSNIKS